MAGLNINESISRTKEFIDLWLKFKQLYKNAMGKPSITDDEEEDFLQTKSLVARKFQTLAEAVSIDRLVVDRAYEIINIIQALKGMPALSEQALRKIDNDWHETYISLNRLLGHLEAQKEAPSTEENAGVKAWKGVMKSLVYIGVIVLLALIILFIMNMLGILQPPSVPAK